MAIKKNKKSPSKLANGGARVADKKMVWRNCDHMYDMMKLVPLQHGHEALAHSIAFDSTFFCAPNDEITTLDFGIR